MPNYYADPQELQPLKLQKTQPKFDVLPQYAEPPGEFKAILRPMLKAPEPEFKVAPQPAYKEAVENRPTSIAEPLPSNQSSNFTRQRRDLSLDPGWKTIEHVPESQTLARHKAGTTFTTYFADSTEMYTDPFMVGLGRRLAGSSPTEDEIYFQHQQEVFPQFDRDSFEAGGYWGDAIKDGWRDANDFTQDAFKNAWDFYKDGWENLPDFKLPKIDLPDFKLPDLNLPEITLPKFDFKPHNEEQQKEKERDEKQRERRIQRRQKREARKESTSDKLDKILDKLPDGCGGTVFFIRHQYSEYDPPIVSPSNLKTRSESLPGRGRLTPIKTFKDRYGNEHYQYRGGDVAGYGREHLFDVSVGSYNDGIDASGTVCEAPFAYHRLVKYEELRDRDGNYIGNRKLTTKDYFKINYNSDPVIDINQYAIDGISIDCTERPPYDPDYRDDLDDTHPEEEPPPEPDDDDKDKKMSCCSCADIAKIVQSTITSMRYTVNIPVITCELNEELQIWETKIESEDIEIFAVSEATAKSQAKLYFDLAQQAKDTCEAKNVQPVAAIPDAWQVAIEGDRPQLIVLFAEVIKTTDGKFRLGRSRYPISIPHYHKPQEFKPVIPDYRKGQYEGKLILKDNSRLVVNAYSPGEAKRVIAQLVQYINPEMFRTNSQGNPIKIPKIIERNGDELKQIIVTPTNANFFSTGRKDMNPDWVKQFR